MNDVTPGDARGGDPAALSERVRALKRARSALILAHNYQRPEIQDVADRTGDSLELARIAAEAPEPVIALCGVRFMAETAALLAPGKTVLLPVPEAGCALAEAATARELRAARERHPDAIVVAYINTTVEVKALSDVCCTSANAVEIVRAVPDDREVLFVSDRNLGRHAARGAGRPVILWGGSCPTHAGLSASDVLQARRVHPGAEVMVHPECEPEVTELADVVAGTAGMLAHAGRRPAGACFVVGTDIGMIHRLRKENPEQRFFPASPYLVCPTMKLTTLRHLAEALAELRTVVTVDDAVRAGARAALDAMLAVSAIHPVRLAR